MLTGRVARQLYIAILILVMVGAAIAPAVYGAGKPKAPEITAAGAEIYCENTGETVFTKAGNKAMDPYSITKLLTALIAVQNVPLDKEVKISKRAASVGYSSMKLKEGEVVTVEELLYGALMKSGNDAAYALAEATSGTSAKFVKLMNKTAQNIGCTHTRFRNPHGLKEKGHYTTASDFIKIARVALSNETIRKIAGTKSYKMPATNKSDARKFKTHVDLLADKDSGVYAGKTGYWSDSEASIAVGFSRDGLDLFIVMLNGNLKDRPKDLKKLIDYAVASVEGVKVIGEGKNVGKVRIRHGAKTRLDAFTSETGYAYLPEEGSKSLISTKTVMDTGIKAPVKEGTVVGTYEIYVGDDIVNKVPLITHEYVETGWFPSYFGISNVASIVILVIIVIIVFLMISIARAKARARRRKRLARERKIMRMAEEQARREEDRRQRGWKF